MQTNTVIKCVLCFLLSIACGYDYRSRRIPNGLILSCLIAGAAFRWWEQGIYGIMEYFLQCFTDDSGILSCFFILVPWEPVT